MITRNTVAAIVALLLPICAYADDADKPDPLAVIDAATAAQRAHNVDAILALWEEDGVLITIIGNKIAGKEKLRDLFTRLTKERMIGNNDINNGVVKGNMVLLQTMVSSRYIVELGVAPIRLNSISVVDGNKIRSRLYYYPLGSVEKIDQACKSPEKRNVLIFNRPCDDFVHDIRAHTEKLIADGVVDKDG